MLIILASKDCIKALNMFIKKNIASACVFYAYDDRDSQSLPKLWNNLKFSFVWALIYIYKYTLPFPVFLSK